jgi:hypothetical protein
MSPGEYMDLLEQRRQEHYAEHGQPRDGFPALLEWFVRDGDDALVDMGAIETANRAHDDRPKRPRHYRPALYWRARLDHIEARMAAINGASRHNTTDPAAYGGIGIRQTARQRARYGARIDRAASEYVRLESDRSHARRMLAAAEKREATA